MAKTDPIQVFSLFESLSKTNHSEKIDGSEFIDFCNSVIADELNLGMDRDKSKIWFIDDLIFYAMNSIGSFRFDTTTSVQRSMTEAFLACFKPSVILNLAPMSSMYLAKLNLPAKHMMVNTPHLYYMEKYGVFDESFDYEMISPFDVEDGVFSHEYDLALIELGYVQHNLDIVKTVVDNLPSGGIAILKCTTDAGMVAEYEKNHDYYELFENLKNREDVNLYHFPTGLGLAVVTKA
jgi:hypothetical protein